MIKYLVKPARRGRLLRKQWRPSVVAANGDKLLWGETYANVDDAVHALVIACGVSPRQVEIQR